MDLDEHKFEHLNALLDQTTIYSKFLYEQMDGLDEEVDAMREKSKRNKRRAREGGGEKEHGSWRKKRRRFRKRKTAPHDDRGDAGLPAQGCAVDDGAVQKRLERHLGRSNGFRENRANNRVPVAPKREKHLGPVLDSRPAVHAAELGQRVQRFCPSFPVVLYHGSKQERADIRAKRLPTATPCNDQFPVIVTSFEIVMADRKFLQKYNFKYLVVDEGHRLKNFDCKLIRELKQIPAANKLLLTGTPLQNSLPELWSLLHFLLPDIFSSLSPVPGLVRL